MNGRASDGKGHENDQTNSNEDGNGGGPMRETTGHDDDDDLDDGGTQSREIDGTDFEEGNEDGDGEDGLRCAHVFLSFLLSYDHSRDHVDNDNDHDDKDDKDDDDDQCERRPRRRLMRPKTKTTTLMLYQTATNDPVGTTEGKWEWDRDHGLPAAPVLVLFYFESHFLAPTLSRTRNYGSPGVPATTTAPAAPPSTTTGGLPQRRRGGFYLLVFHGHDGKGTPPQGVGFARP
jgi:hypothetical protein